jgi:glycosyltransferase involved in cell wall biosynthesis
MERRSEKESNMLAKVYTESQAKKIRFYERHQCTKFDLNITVSDADANHLRSMLPGIKTATVPNGVDTDYFRPDPADKLTERAIIYTGGMNMYANRDAVSYFLSSMWRRIKSKLPDVRFYVVGQDPPQELRKFAEGDKNIIITGYVDDIRPYVSRSAAYVVPLRVGGGTRLKILDAMAMGKAIVSTTIGAEGILATDGKNILLADEPFEFASKTIELLTSSRKREILGAEARKLVEQQYSWGIIGERLQHAYEQVLEEKK